MIFRSTIIMVLAAVAVFACRFSPEPSQGEESGVVMSLPSSIGPFIGEPGEVSKVERETLPSDTEMTRMIYHTAGARAVDRDALTTTIVLSGTERRSIHRPEVCLTGQGWSIVDAQTMPVTLADGQEFSVRDLLIEKPQLLEDGSRKNLRAHYVYWFVGSDVTTPSHWTRMWLSSRDSILRNVNHRWAYPAILGLVTDNFEPAVIGQKKRNSDETLDLIKRLIHELAPKFQPKKEHR